MSLFDILLKIALTIAIIIGLIIALLGGAFALRKIWTKQIDAVETVKSKVKETSDWIKTKEPDAIYQDGKIVGNVSGNVEEINGNIVFHELCNTSGLNKEMPFEYRRDKLKIVNVGSIIGQSTIATDKGTETKRDILKDVVCEKIK